MYFVSAAVIRLASLALIVQVSLPHNKTVVIAKHRSLLIFMGFSMAGHLLRENESYVFQSLKRQLEYTLLLYCWFSNSLITRNRICTSLCSVMCESSSISDKLLSNKGNRNIACFLQALC